MITINRVPLKDIRVVVHINGVIADVVIKQKYANSGIRPINARYIFPASTRASVHGMKIIIDGEVIIAEIKEGQSAQKEFDQAKKQGKNASLLKQQRPNVFSQAGSDDLVWILRPIADLVEHISGIAFESEANTAFVNRGYGIIIYFHASNSWVWPGMNLKPAWIERSMPMSKTSEPN